MIVHWRIVVQLPEYQFIFHKLENEITGRIRYGVSFNGEGKCPVKFSALEIRKLADIADNLRAAYLLNLIKKKL